VACNENCTFLRSCVSDYLLLGFVVLLFLAYYFTISVFIQRLIVVIGLNRSQFLSSRYLKEKFKEHVLIEFKQHVLEEELNIVLERRVQTCVEKRKSLAPFSLSLSQHSTLSVPPKLLTVFTNYCRHNNSHIYNAPVFRKRQIPAVLSENSTCENSIL